MPDFAQVYGFLGSVFDPNSTNHLEKLRQMDPINVETVININSIIFFSSCLWYVKVQNFGFKCLVCLAEYFILLYFAGIVVDEKSLCQFNESRV